MTVPAVLLTADFTPLWSRVRTTLERRGLGDRGAMSLPDGLAPSVYARLRELLADPRFTSSRRTLDLAALEGGLARHDVDLPGLLAAAGQAPQPRRERRDAARERREARDAALAEVLADLPWREGWTHAVRGGLLDADAVRAAARSVEAVLALGADDRVRSRAEVASLALGAAHALDRGTPARRWVRAALAHRAGDPDRDDPELWDDAGLPGDLVSAPVLTWALPLTGRGVPEVVRAATDAGAPTPLTVLTLRDLAVAVPEGTVVLSVENPRLLEAAVQRRLSTPVICSFGNPTRAYGLLLDGLLAAGALVRHHGDIDADGLAITARLHARGAHPWRMTVVDYTDARHAADEAGVDLPAVDPERVPATPWEPALADAVRTHGVAVEEERVMDTLLGASVDDPA